MDQQVPNIVMGTPAHRGCSTGLGRSTPGTQDNVRTILSSDGLAGVGSTSMHGLMVRFVVKWNIFAPTQYQIYVINSSITSSANHFIKTSTLILHFRIRNNYHFLYFSSGQLLTACRPPALANIRLENLSLNIDQISENQIKINHSKQENNYWTYWLYFKSPTFHQHQLSAVFWGLLEELCWDIKCFHYFLFCQFSLFKMLPLLSPSPSQRPSSGSVYNSAGGRGGAAWRGGGCKNRIIHHDNFNLFYSTQEYIKSSARNKCKWKCGFQNFSIMIFF